MKLQAIHAGAISLSKEEGDRRINKCLEATKEKKYILSPAECKPFLKKNQTLYGTYLYRATEAGFKKESEYYADMLLELTEKKGKIMSVKECQSITKSPATIREYRKKALALGYKDEKRNQYSSDDDE